MAVNLLRRIGRHTERLLVLQRAVHRCLPAYHSARAAFAGGEIEAGIRSVASYNAYHTGGRVSSDDVGLDALALIEFADRDDGENLHALLDRSNLRELARQLTAVALTWGTELAERQGYGSLAEKIADLRMTPDICPVCGHEDEPPADGCACRCHVG